MTVSCADIHNPIIQNQMHSHLNSIINVSENPHVVDEVFGIMLNNLFEEWLKKNYNIKWHFIRYEYQNRGTIHAHIILKLSDEPSIGDHHGLIALGNLCIAGYEA